jgi:hypothetical protein
MRDASKIVGEGRLVGLAFEPQQIVLVNLDIGDGPGVFQGFFQADLEGFILAVGGPGQTAQGSA